MTNIKNQKFLYIDSEQIVKNSMLWGLLELELNVERAILKIDIFSKNEEAVNTVIHAMKEYDIAISQDFIPDVAKACNILGKPYISWVYDCPQVALFEPEALLDTNYIFMFDKSGVNMLKDKGIKHIFYQPLVANILQAGMLDITDEDIIKFGSDVSFVGSLYEKDYLDIVVNSLSTESKKELMDYVDSNKLVFSKNDSYVPHFSERLVSEVYKLMVTNQYKTSSIDPEYAVNGLVALPLFAKSERTELINRAASRYNTRLYTNSQDTSLISAHVFPPVDSETDMYKVFYSSKINLNITWRGIISGIPQRIFDIMAVGGFVLSNYQSEMDNLFEIGKDLEVFHDLKEYDEKLQYYLNHERERITIGINGYKKVKELYNYSIALNNMFSIVEAHL